MNTPSFFIPVFFSQDMLADAHHFSPSALKPGLVVASWRQLDIPIRVIPPFPLKYADLLLAHAPAYVDGVMHGMIVNGFGNRLPEVNASLLYTNGAMVAAARECLCNKRVAVAPCSGFHHAGYGYGGDYCTFNGLIIAARKLLEEGLVKRVGILDFDMHYGDGTDDIIKHLDLSHSIAHYSAGAYFDVAPPERQSALAECFLNAIERIIEDLGPVDILLYQAGADQHCDDPLGGFLTTEQLMERDRRVFAACRSRNIPISWNLAGGYQRDSQDSIRPVLDIHNNTLKACWEVMGH